MSSASSRLRYLFEQARRYQQAGSGEELERVYRQILESPPASGTDFFYQGSVLTQMGLAVDALARFDIALGMGVVTAELFIGRSVALAELRRFEEAVADCESALRLKPGSAHTHFLHGDYLRELGHLEEALANYNTALTITPAFVAALVNRGQVLGELFRFEEALKSLEVALTIEPRHVKALHDHGVILYNLERFEEALVSYDRALALNPNPITLSTRANTLQELMRLDEASAAHDRVVAMQADFADGHWNRGLDLLLRGNWKEGFEEFEWRKKRPGNLHIASSQLEWLGQDDLAGKTLLVYAEQGLGDVLQFSRYLALAQARGARVIFAVQDVLLRLMQSLEPRVEIVSFREMPLHFDHHVATMSLPMIFGSTEDDVPAGIPYLKAEPDLIQSWGRKLGGEEFKIGISWRGGGLGKIDVGRAYPVSLLARLAQLKGARLISLQKGQAALEQLSCLPPGMTVETLEAFDEGPDAFIDTAAVMENLDLVISSDTAVAHLAGALGRPTWLALKRVPDWRWGLTGSQTPWYPTMRLFRQHAVGTWDGVFAAMETELKKLLGRSLG